MKSKILLISLVAVLALSIGLVGCTGEGPTPTPASIKIAYPGGMGPGAGLTTIDPCNGNYGGPDYPNIFETLISQDADEELIPLLAASMPTWSVDMLTLTVDLKTGVVFSDGSPFTADDVVFSLQRYIDINPGGPVRAQLDYAQGYLNCTKVDSDTVEFTFWKENVQFVPQTLVNVAITSKTYYDSVGEEAYKDCPVGTGPYKIDTWEEGVSCNVSYNDKYRGDKPQIEQAQFIVYGMPATGVSMLKAGEVDLLSQAPGSSITELEGLGYNNIPVVMPHALAIVFNLLGYGTQPWDDVRVRQAINYAINKDAIKGSLIAGPIQDGTWVLPSSPWYPEYSVKGLDPSYAYNLSMAEDLMTAAGCGSFSLNLTYIATETVSPLAEYLASSLSAIGITVNLDPISDFMAFMGSINSVYQPYFVDGNYTGTPATPNAFLYDPGWPGNPEVAIDLTNGFYSGKDNTLFDDSDIDDLVDDVLSEPDESTRYGLAAEAWEKIDDLLPAIPIGQEVQTNFSIPTVVYIKSIGGMTAGPRQLVDLRVVEE